MAFNLGNFTVKEIIRGVAEDFSGNLLYTLDQLQNASIEISADSTDVTDKDGAVIRTMYKGKTGTFNATSAMLSPALLNAQSGSPIETAALDNVIAMPRMLTVAPGSATDISGAKDGTVKVMGIYSNGANGAVLTQSAEDPVLNKTFKLETDDDVTTLTVPAASEGAPQKYLVVYEYDSTEGIKISNYSDKYPDTIKMTLYLAVMDPCSDKYMLGICEIGSLQPDPSVTINLDSENQQVDFTGKINVDYCSAEGKLLYTLYFPNTEAVVTGTIA